MADSEEREIMGADTLSPADGSTHRTKRVGRGIGSGVGKTAGRGHKGQKARSGGHVRPGFEGGQMPLDRRIPKRGFNNKWRVIYMTINIGQLAEVPAGTVVDYDYVVEHGLAKKVPGNIGLKVLGNGELKNAITVRALKFTESAKDIIEKAGGKAEVIPGKNKYIRENLKYKLTLDEYLASRDGGDTQEKQ